MRLTSWPWGEGRELANGATAGFLLALPILIPAVCLIFFLTR